MTQTLTYMDLRTSQVTLMMLCLLLQKILIILVGQSFNGADFINLCSVALVGGKVLLEQNVILRPQTASTKKEIK